MPQALSNLPVGAKVKFGKYQVNTEDAQPIIWTIVAKNHQCTPAYPENAITLHATEILDLRCFDAKEPDSPNPQPRDKGNNRYSQSNIDQWLNKDSVAGEWYIAAHETDHSPDTSDGTGGYGTQYATRPGFLHAFRNDEKAAILLTTIRVVVGQAYNGATYEDITRRVFLPSRVEVGCGVESHIRDGDEWGYYTSDSDRTASITQQCFDNTLANPKNAIVGNGWYWWLRTPGGNDLYRLRYVSTSGSSAYQAAASGAYGVRPALNLSSSLLVSDSTDADGCYTFVWTSPTDYTFTLNGTQYTNVAKINYVSGNTTKQIKKLVVNGSTVWQA